MNKKERKILKKETIYYYKYGRIKAYSLPFARRVRVLHHWLVPSLFSRHNLSDRDPFSIPRIVRSRLCRWKVCQRPPRLDSLSRRLSLCPQLNIFLWESNIPPTSEPHQKGKAVLASYRLQFASTNEFRN